MKKCRIVGVRVGDRIQYKNPNVYGNTCLCVCMDQCSVALTKLCVVKGTWSKTSTSSSSPMSEVESVFQSIRDFLLQTQNITSWISSCRSVGTEGFVKRTDLLWSGWRLKTAQHSGCSPRTFSAFIRQLCSVMPGCTFTFKSSKDIISINKHVNSSLTW